MTTNKFAARSVSGVAIALAIGFSSYAPVASAAFPALVAGNTIKITDSFGSNGGGEFTATTVLGNAGSFQTFCLEYNESLYYGETMTIQAISTGAVSGGVSGGNPDLISYQTAYLYTGFAGGTLSTAYDYGNTAQHALDASSLQLAIWHLEGETANAGVLALYNADAKAQALVTEANGAGWTNIGNVRALNLLRQAGGNGQDQLYITPIPEPESYAMMLAGLGLIGFVARRRRRASGA